MDDTYETWIQRLRYTPHQGWTANRNIRRLYEEGRIQRLGVSYLIALAYLPGSNTAFPDVPAVGSNTQPGPEVINARVDYACSRAMDPDAVARFFLQDPSSPATDRVEAWVTKRSDRLEELLLTFAELDISPPVPSSASSGLEVTSVPFAPWHYLVAIALDASNVIFEVQAAQIVVTRAAERLRRNFRASQRLYIMGRAADHINWLEMLPQRQERSTEKGGESTGRTIVSICSDLIRAMVRLAEARIKKLQRETSIGRTSELDHITNTDANGTAKTSLPTSLSDNPVDWPSESMPDNLQGTNASSQLPNLDVDFWKLLQGAVDSAVDSGSNGEPSRDGLPDLAQDADSLSRFIEQLYGG